MSSTPRARWIVALIISILALADGFLHLMLDVVIFRGNFFGRLGPPPAAAPPPPPAGGPAGPPVPLPLPLNQLFVLNCLGYIVLVSLFWLVYHRQKVWHWWVDVLLLVYVVAVFLGWVDYGRPNPQGLGYLSKAIETVLAIALLTHLWLLSKQRSMSV